MLLKKSESYGFLMWYSMTCNHPHSNHMSNSVHVRHSIHMQDARNGHLLIVAFTNEQQQPPSLDSGQNERRDADSRDEAAGGLWSPFLNDEALL